MGLLHLSRKRSDARKKGASKHAAPTPRLLHTFQAACCASAKVRTGTLRYNWATQPLHEIIPFPGTCYLVAEKTWTFKPRLSVRLGRSGLPVLRQHAASFTAKRRSTPARRKLSSQQPVLRQRARLQLAMHPSNHGTPVATFCLFFELAKRSRR